jgi:hypothetical protein
MAKGVMVHGLPTWWGSLGYRLRREGPDALRLELDAGLRVPPGGIVVRPPLPGPLAGAEGDGVARVDAWSANPPDQSGERAADDLEEEKCMSGKKTSKRDSESPLSADELRKLDALWRASNYLSVGQIYLLDNPLLTKPLAREHIKPRLLGHWGTTPGLNFLYVHLNRVIRANDLDMIYVIGPGHGGPSLRRARLLGRDLQRGLPEHRAGRRRDEEAVQAVQLPGRHPEPRRARDAGSIHEGGELGYALSHAYGAAFDNPI